MPDEEIVTLTKAMAIYIYYCTIFICYSNVNLSRFESDYFTKIDVLP